MSYRHEQRGCKRVMTEGWLRVPNVKGASVWRKVGHRDVVSRDGRRGTAQSNA